MNTLFVVLSIAGLVLVASMVTLWLRNRRRLPPVAPPSNPRPVPPPDSIPQPPPQWPS